MTAPRDASARWLRAARALSPERTLLSALEIRHPDVVAPIRIVNDARDWTIEGETFIGVRFGARLASDQEGAPPRAEIVVDNVGAVLTGWIERARGGADAGIRIIQVSVDPGNAQAAPIVEWEMHMKIERVKVTRTQVSARLGLGVSARHQAVAARYDTARAPGLF